MKARSLSVCFLFILMFVSYGYSQIGDTNEKPKVSCDDNGLMETRQWSRVFLPLLSICIPSDMKAVPLKCFEGGCYRYESKDATLYIDLDPAAGRPTSQRYLPSYKEDHIFLDGKAAWIWYFEDRGKFKGKSGANFKLDEKRDYSLGVYVSSRQPGKHEFAKSIFSTIKFNHTSK